MLRIRVWVPLALVLVLLRPAASQSPEWPLAGKLQGDALPQSAITRLGTTRMRHAGEVVALVFSPDGKLLLSGGGQGDPSVYLWDLATGESRLRLPVERPIDAAAFSHDGKLIAAACGAFGHDSEKIVRVWDTTIGRELPRLNLGDLVYGISFSPDGKLLGLNCADGRILLWKPGKQPRLLARQKGEGHELVFSPDGKLIATGVTEWPNPADHWRKVFVIRLWDVMSGKIIHELPGHEESIRALVFSPNGKHLASGGRDEQNTVRLWDVASGKELPALQQRQGDTRALHFSADGRTLRAAAVDGKLRAWQLPEGKALPAPGPLQGIPHRSNAVAFSPAGDRLAMGNWLGAAGGTNSISLWDVTTGKRLLTFEGHDGDVKALAFSVDGKRLASLGGDGILLWDVARRRPVCRFGVRLDQLDSFSISGDGTLLAAQGRDTGSVRLWDTRTGKELPGFTSEKQERDRGRGGGVRFSADGEKVVVTEPGRSLLVFSVASRQRSLQTLAPDLAPLWCGGFTPDGKEIVAACGASLVRWNASSGKERLRIGKSTTLLDVYGYWTDAVALAPDGRTLAVGARNGAFGLWETATGKEIVRLAPADNDYERSIQAAAFSPDSRYVLAGVRGGGFRVWDTLTGEELTRRMAHGGSVSSLAFTPDGRTLASGSTDTTILLWDFPALLNHRPRMGNTLEKPELEKLWSQLEKEEGRAAYRAIAALGDSGAIDFLRERLVVQRVERKEIERHIAHLDDPRFAERQKAVQALKRFGKIAEPELRSALDRPVTLEMRRRIEDILDALPGDESTVARGERLRGLRCLAVLEYIGSPAARGILQSLSREAGDTVVRSEAGAALARLPKPSSK
jgi:WD40 repeat protein